MSLENVEPWKLGSRAPEKRAGRSDEAPARSPRRRKAGCTTCRCIPAAAARIAVTRKIIGIRD